MLVLSRKLREKILLTDCHTGHEIAEIVLVSIDTYGRASIGVTAGPEVQILRSELRDDPAVKNRKAK